MTDLTLDFGQYGGGIQLFSNVGPVSTFVDRQERAYREPDRFGKIIAAGGASLIDSMAKPWKDIGNYWRSVMNGSSSVELALEKSRKYLEKVAPVSAGSAAVAAILDTFVKRGATQAEAVRSWFTSRSQDIRRFPEEAQASIFGAIRYIEHYGVGDPADLVDAVSLRATVERLKLVAEQYEHRLGTIERDAAIRAAAREDEADTTLKALASLQTSAAGDWANVLNAYSAQLSLQAPVALWVQRSTENTTAAKKAVTRLVLCGALGIVGAALWAAGALEAAKWLLEEAKLTDAVSPTPNGLRPTFHVELIIASAATLVYLTMYLWMMRMLVRSYTTHEHLAIDARSRASMAETYLALTKEGAATEAERAIVLTSLFRPVTDGMVKDEGPPPVSPAAVVAGLVSGKGS